MFRAPTPMFLFAPDGESAPPPSAPPPPERGPRKLEFTQDELDRLIAQRLDHERRKIEASLGGPDAISELETLRKERDDRTRKEQEAKGNYDRALQSVQEKHRAEAAKWAEERSAHVNVIRTERVLGRLIAKAAERRAIKPEQVARLLDSRVRLDDGFNVIVLDEVTGQPAFDGGKPLTLDRLVEEFESANPHLFQPAGTGGSGSRGGASTSSEGAAPGTTRELLAAREALDAARKAAMTSNQPADITAVQQAKRKLAALEAAQRSA